MGGRWDFIRGMQLIESILSALFDFLASLFHVTVKSTAPMDELQQQQKEKRRSSRVFNSMEQRSNCILRLGFPAFDKLRSRRELKSLKDSRGRRYRPPGR